MFASLDQGHGIRSRHDWWWNLTWPQAAVIVAVVLAAAAVWIAYLFEDRR